MEEKDYFDIAIEETKLKVKTLETGIRSQKKELALVRKELRRRETAKNIFFGIKKPTKIKKEKQEEN